MSGNDMTATLFSFLDNRLRCIIFYTMKKFLICLLLGCATPAIAFADDCAVGLSLINAGKFDEGRDYIRRAYRNNPSSAAVQCAYARICAGGEEAAALYRKLAATASAKDSLRAEAFFRLGLFHYAAERYDSAQALFTKSEKLFPHKTFSCMVALAAGNRKDFPAAEAACLSMLSQEAAANKSLGHYYCGGAWYRQERYAEAYTCYRKAAETANEAQGAALAGACLSAYAAGDLRQGDALYEQLHREYPLFLESALVEAAANMNSFEDAGRSPSADQPVQESVLRKKEDRPGPKKTGTEAYTLQVGAFTSKDNAKKLYNDLRRDFKNAFIKEETVNQKVFYRVRVGGFYSEAEALEFGEKKLREKGFNFRVVKEQPAGGAATGVQ